MIVKSKLGNSKDCLWFVVWFVVCAGGRVELAFVLLKSLIREGTARLTAEWRGRMSHVG